MSIALVPICPDLTRIDIMPGQFDKLMSFRFYSEDLVFFKERLQLPSQQ